MDKRNFLLVSMILVMVVSSVNAEDSIANLYEESYTLEGKGDYSGAVNKVLQILRTDNKDYTASLRAGWLFYLNGDYASAVTYYKKAMAIEPGAVEPVLGISLPLMAGKQWTEAEKKLTLVLAKDPGNYLVYSRLAYISFSLGKYGEAKDRYEHVLKLYPSDLEMKLGMGWTYVRMGNKRKAVEYFSEVLRVQKSNVSALAGMDAVRQM
jgi:tetratricopeptide (TPR) repeat protein